MRRLNEKKVFTIDVGDFSKESSKLFVDMLKKDISTKNDEEWLISHEEAFHYFSINRLHLAKFSLLSIIELRMKLIHKNHCS